MSAVGHSLTRRARDIVLLHEAGLAEADIAQVLRFDRDEVASTVRRFERTMLAELPSNDIADFADLGWSAWA